eukprot:7139740-Lingulodinium_polyedra.AAC.1
MADAPQRIARIDPECGFLIWREPPLRVDRDNSIGPSSFLPLCTPKRTRPTAPGPGSRGPAA